MPLNKANSIDQANGFWKDVDEGKEDILPISPMSAALLQQLDGKN
jgi:hypothetical protein